MDEEARQKYSKSVSYLPEDKSALYIIIYNYGNYCKVMAFQNWSKATDHIEAVFIPQGLCSYCRDVCLIVYILSSTPSWSELEDAEENEAMSSHSDMKKGHSFREKAYSPKT